MIGLGLGFVSAWAFDAGHYGVAVLFAALAGVWLGAALREILG